MEWDLDGHLEQLGQPLIGDLDSMPSPIIGACMCAFLWLHKRTPPQTRSHSTSTACRTNVHATHASAESEPLEFNSSGYATNGGHPTGESRWDFIMRAQVCILDNGDENTGGFTDGD